MATIHELPLEQRVLHGHFSKDLEPAIEIELGDSVRFFTPNHAWDVARDERFAPPSPELDQGHALAGPILVRGAKAGQTLVVRIDEVEVGRLELQPPGGEAQRGDHQQAS